MRFLKSTAAVIALTAMAFASIAQAEIIQISATALVLRSDSGTDSIGTAQNGVLQNARGKFYAPVVFPANGDDICRFSMVYRDFDAEADITARLLRKPLNVGGFAFNPPNELASVASFGTNQNMRRATTTDIAGANIALATNFYFVEVDLPANTLQVVGLQIDFRPICE